MKKKLSYDEIIEMARNLPDCLVGELANWRYIVASGGGIHIYYFGDPIEIKDPSEWSCGAKAFGEMFWKELA